MKKTREKRFAKVTRYLFLLILAGLISQGILSEARAQYLTSTANPQGVTGDSFYSVSLYSENISELRSIISVEAEAAPVREVLEHIVQKANLGLAYNAELLALEKPVSIRLSNVTVAAALERVLEGTGFEATISRTREIVLREAIGSRRLSAAKVEQAISGVVTDAESGEPLPGVNVVVPGTNIGTSTDGTGRYALTAPDDADSLAFSFIGYESQTVAINNRTTINIQLTANVQAFEDIVVTALGITRDERSIGYSVQKVDGDELTLTREQNIIGSLAGKIAGVQVIGASGASMGGTQKIQIRGVNSLSGASAPLMVVDGTPISNANFSSSTGRDFGNLAQDINPEDIESINVLKGPAASALYGIRGQYGVIMITTKKGQKGAESFTVELNSSFMVERIGNLMPLQNKYGAGSNQTWNTLANGDPYVTTLADESWGPKMDGTPVRHYYSFYPQDPDYGKLTPFSPHPDNVKDFFETGTNFSQGVTISGGSDRSNIRLSFNNTDIEGIEPNTYLKRNNLGLSAGADISDRWNVSANVNFAFNRARRPTQGAEAGTRYFYQWFQRSLDIERMKNYRYDDGTFMHWNLRNPNAATGEIANRSPVYFNNPYFDAYENLNGDSRTRVFGDIGVTYKIMPELELKGFIRSDTYTQNLENRTAFGGKSTPGYYTGKFQNMEMNYELLAQYKQQWNAFSIDANMGANVYDRHYTYVTQSTVGGLSAPGFYNIEASIDRPNTSSYLLNKRVLSAYGLVSLGYRDTYFIDISLRNDNSSALPADNNSYWYPSVSGSLVFSELLNLDALHLGKLRLSYAQAGSDLSPYQTTPTYLVGTEYGSITTLRVPSNLNNPDVKPSFSHSYEAGIDLNFLSRFGLSFTYYVQKNENQIIDLNVSGASGYASTTINAGLIENRGVELSLNGAPVQSRNFSWNTSFNISRNKGEVIELHPNIDQYLYGSTTYSSVTTYLRSYEGMAFGTIEGQAYERDEDTGKIMLDDNNLPLYTDATHNFGTVLPDFNGGFQNYFNYKNFELAAMIDFQIGGQFFSRTQSLADRTGQSAKTAALNDLGNNVRDPILDKDGNEVATVSTGNAGAGSGGVKVSGISASTGNEVTAYVNAKDYYGRLGQQIAEPYIYDATYIKLREVRLGYSFGNEVLQHLPFQNMTVSLIARNPVMIWQDAPKGLDPSELSTGSQSISWYESGQLNSVRSFGIDLNITF